MHHDASCLYSDYSLARWAKRLLIVVTGAPLHSCAAGEGLPCLPLFPGLALSKRHPRFRGGGGLGPVRVKNVLVQRPPTRTRGEGCPGRYSFCRRGLRAHGHGAACPGPRGYGGAAPSLSPQRPRTSSCGAAWEAAGTAGDFRELRRPLRSLVTSQEAEWRPGRAVGGGRPLREPDGAAICHPVPRGEKTLWGNLCDKCLAAHTDGGGGSSTFWQRGTEGDGDLGGGESRGARRQGHRTAQLCVPTRETATLPPPAGGLASATSGEPGGPVWGCCSRVRPAG